MHLLRTALAAALALALAAPVALAGQGAVRDRAAGKAANRRMKRDHPNVAVMGVVATVIGRDVGRGKPGKRVAVLATEDGAVGAITVRPDGIGDPLKAKSWTTGQSAMLPEGGSNVISLNDVSKGEQKKAAAPSPSTAPAISVQLAGQVLGRPVLGVVPISDERQVAVSETRTLGGRAIEVTPLRKSKKGNWKRDKRGGVTFDNGAILHRP